MRTLYTDAVVLVTETCYACGVLFAMTEDFHTSRKRDKREFHCPNGHAQTYVRTEADELREQLERERARVTSKEQCIARLRQDVATLEQSKLGLRGRLAQALKQRAGRPGRRAG